MIWLASVEVAELIRQVVRSPSIHVPMGVDGEGLGMAVLAVLIIVLRRAIRHSHLALIIPRVLAIIAETEEGPLKTAVTLGCPMTFTTT
jgi:hypothetical protein